VIHLFEIIVTNYESIPSYVLKKKNVPQILRNASKYQLKVSYGDGLIGGSSQLVSEPVSCHPTPRRHASALP